MPPRVALQRAWLALRLLLVACAPLCMTTFSNRAPRDPKWAERAKCFLVEDQEKLLAVIESGFGSLAPFNQLIRSVFRDARATHLESLVVHLQREQTELHAKIDRLLQHQGVASVAVAPEEDELAA